MLRNDKMTTALLACARRALSLCLLVGGSLPFVASAQQPAWTLDSVEQAALERSPRIRRARAALETANAYRTFGKLPPVENPYVNMRAMVGKPDDPAATYAVVLGVPFQVSGKRRAWRREAGFIVNQAEAELSAVSNEVRANARAAYVQVALSEAARGVAQDSAAIAQELVTRVGARLSARAATALDLSLAESQLSEAVADVARSERALVEAQGDLRQVLGLAAIEPIAITPLALPALPDGLTVEQAITRAQQYRRETAVFENERERWRAADRRLRAEAIGPLSLGFEVEQQANTNPRRSVGANLGAELPFIQRNQGERAVARKQSQAAEVDRAISEETIAREATTAYQRLEAALREMTELESRALPAAERTLEMVFTMLEAGAIDYFRVLTARSGAFALRRRRVEALREAWLSRIALERAMGGWKESP
jgi:outer membrane protein TolC